MKILVVDDDKIIRMGLMKILKRMFTNHKVVGDFQNGKLALEFLKENSNSIDLVITDIKMPIMTGIELIEKSIEELDNPPVFLVLSGYDEFTYVRDSMKSGAHNYLLKPIQEKELKKVIDDIETKVSENKQKQQLFNKSIDILKRDFFKHIIFPNNDINIKTDRILLENIQIDENYSYELVIVEKTYCINNIKKLINEIISNNSNIESSFFIHDGNAHIVFYYNNRLVDANELVELIKSNTQSFIVNKQNIFILNSTKDISELKIKASLIKRFQKGLYYEKVSKRYYEKEIILECSIERRLDMEILNTLKDSIIKAFESGKEEVIKESFEKVFNDLKRSKINKEEFALAFTKIVNNLYEIYPKMKILIKENKICLTNFLIKENNFHEGRNYFYKELSKLTNLLYNEYNNTNARVVELSKKYIIDNYHRNITLKEVSDTVFLSPNYFCELFKKEVGQSFYDFLSNYRMKKAKDLLITTNLKVYEVAEQVGYNDAVTFCRAFKKISGTTPNDFRNSKVIM